MSELLRRVRRVRRWVERALEMGEKGDMMGFVEDLELAQAELSSVREEMWSSLLGSRRRSSRRFRLALCVAAVALSVFAPRPLSFPPSLPALSLSIRPSMGLGAGLEGLASLPRASQVSSGGLELPSRSPGGSPSSEAVVPAPSSVARKVAVELERRKTPESSSSAPEGASFSVVREGEVARLVRLARRELSGGGAIKVLVKLDDHQR